MMRGLGIGVLRNCGMVCSASPMMRRPAKNRRAVVASIGVLPARGKTIATAPSRTMPEMKARSASVRPQGGTTASSAPTAMSPTRGAPHINAMATALQAARIPIFVMIASRIGYRARWADRGRR